MAAIGHRNVLSVVREAPPGLYLDGEELGEILLPRRYIPKGTVPGDALEVFVHRDSEDRLVATTEIPRACVGEFACMKVVSFNLQIGAFLDWGLTKDLLLPIREQSRRVAVGESVVAPYLMGFAEVIYRSLVVTFYLQLCCELKMGVPHRLCAVARPRPGNDLIRR